MSHNREPNRDGKNGGNPTVIIFDTINADEKLDYMYEDWKVK